MAAKKGPSQPNIAMSHTHRLKIQNSNILKVLIEHAEGNREMSASQVTAGLGLLKKCLPDLATMTIEGNPEKPLVQMIITGVPRIGDA